MVFASGSETTNGDGARGICGVLTLIGGAGLLWRRLTNQRVRATSTTPDIIIMSILLIQCLLGQVPYRFQHSILMGAK